TPLGVLVLGCTHYPILRDVISETVGREITLIDSGEATARDVESLLESSDLTHEDTLGLYQERQLCDDLDHFYVTDAAERFAKVAERFLGSAPSILEAVEIWGHDELRTHRRTRFRRTAPRSNHAGLSSIRGRLRPDRDGKHSSGL